MNLMMLLDTAALAFGERIAFSNGQDTLSYSALYAASGRFARHLTEADTDFCALLDVSSLALPVALFAASWSGKPFVPLNYRLSEQAIAALLSRISPATLVGGAQAASSYATLDGVAFLSTTDLTALSDGIAQGEAHTGKVASDWSMDSEAPAVRLFTSGTTGAPKAAVLRQRHLVSYIYGNAEFGSAAEEEAVLVAVPPYHIAGVISILSAVYAGRRVVQMPDFSPRRWIELVNEERVTSAFVVPTMLRAILLELETRQANCSADAMPTLRALAYGGGKMPLPVIEKAMTLLPDVQFTQAYGLTETSSTVSVLLPEHHREAFTSDDPGVRRRLSSAGRPLPGIEVEIRDQQGKKLGPGECGEIHVRGEQIAGEYAELGSTLDETGWFHTRDAGELDVGGFLHVSGRSDDVIVHGAENISPGEIEAILVAHAAVEDAAVVGVPDETWGEAIAAVVVLSQGADLRADDIREWVRQHLRSSRVPQLVRFADALPYNETGKLLRRVVRTDFGVS